MYTLIYKSQFCSGISLIDVDNIHMISQAKNREYQITGCLYFTIPYVIQILQGKQECVMRLYNNINKDRRHHSVSLLMSEDYPTQLFPRWSMRKVRIHNEETYLRFIHIFEGRFTSNLISDLVAISFDNPNW